MSLLNLAPDIQEDVLYLPKIVKGSDPVTSRDLIAVAQESDWAEQRRRGRLLLSDRSQPPAQAKSGCPAGQLWWVGFLTSNWRLRSTKPQGQPKPSLPLTTTINGNHLGTFNNSRDIPVTCRQTSACGHCLASGDRVTYMTLDISDEEPLNELHVLFAIVGLSPAVLTESVFALCTREEPDVPDRIIVVTTSRGYERTKEALFIKGAWGSLVSYLNEKIGPGALVGKLKFGPASDCLRLIPKLGLSGDLDDILTSDDNKAVANFMLDQLSALCSQDNIRVTASIAGGRKTMGALLLSALSIVGRPQDRAVHVLVSEPWERIAEFAFPGCAGQFRCPNTGATLRSSDAQLVLADVPFVPLRRLFERELKLAGSDLDRLADKLAFAPTTAENRLSIQFDMAQGKVSVCDVTVPLSPMEFALLATLASRAREEQPKLVQYVDLEEPLLAFVHQHQRPDDFGHWSHLLSENTYAPKEAYRKASSSIRKKLQNLGFSRFEIECLLPCRGNICMRLRPERITIL